MGEIEGEGFGMWHFLGRKKGILRGKASLYTRDFQLFIMLAHGAIWVPVNLKTQVPGHVLLLSRSYLAGVQKGQLDLMP